jgi:hypothetical protein
MTKVTTTEQQRQTCRDFAESYVETVREIYAAERCQGNVGIILNQAYWAKLAEVAVEEEIQRLGIPILHGVDFAIHQRRQKSFDADIKTTHARCHVKSVHHDRPETSWAFQKSDPLVYKPEEQDILVFCVTYPTWVDIVGACRATEALPFYAPPRKTELSRTKDFLYLKNHPHKPSVPEIILIVQPLADLLQRLMNSEKSQPKVSPHRIQRYSWKEF